MKSQNLTCHLCFNICGNKVKACLTWDVCGWWVVRLWQCGWDGKTCGHSVTMTSSIIMLFWCNETPPHRTHPTILSVSLTTTKQTAVSWSDPTFTYQSSLSNKIVATWEKRLQTGLRKQDNWYFTLYCPPTARCSAGFTWFCLAGLLQESCDCLFVYVWLSVVLVFAERTLSPVGTFLMDLCSDSFFVVSCIQRPPHSVPLLAAATMIHTPTQRILNVSQLQFWYLETKILVT